MNALTQSHFAAAETIPVYEALDLTKNGTLAQIRLNGMVYTLRITRAGKLILTK